jgi:hypothetical protein
MELFLLIPGPALIVSRIQIELYPYSDGLLSLLHDPARMISRRNSITIQMTGPARNVSRSNSISIQMSSYPFYLDQSALCPMPVERVYEHVSLLLPGPVRIVTNVSRVIMSTYPYYYLVPLALYPDGTLDLYRWAILFTWSSPRCVQCQ